MKYDPRFPPVHLLSALEPFSAPQQNVYGLGRDAGVEFVRPEEVARQPETAPSGQVVKVSNAQQFAYMISQQVTVNTDSVKILDQSAVTRNLLGFRNTHATIGVWIDFGSNANQNSWVYLPPGGTGAILFDNVVPQDDVYAVANAAGGTLTMIYSTFNPKL